MDFNIALVCHEYPPYMIGGVGAYTYNLSRFLSKRRISTTVFCGLSKSPKKERINDYLTLVRLPFLDIPLRAYWFQIRNCHLLLKQLPQYDVVHAINPQSSAITVLARKENDSLVTTIHWVPSARARRFFGAPFSEWNFQDLFRHLLEAPINDVLHQICFTRAKRIIAVGQNVLDEARLAFSNLNSKNVSVIPNAIDFDKIRRIWESMKKNDAESDKYIVFHGRLIWVKGITFLIKALAELKERIPHFKARIIGQGSLRPKLEKMVTKLRLSDNVEFLGHLKHHDQVIKQVLGSSVVVLPSLWEAGACISVLEAMACQKPIIVFDYPFAREAIVNFENGILVPPCNIDELADKIEILWRDRNLREKLGQNSFRYAYENHNWEGIIDKYVEVYQNACS